MNQSVHGAQCAIARAIIGYLFRQENQATNSRPRRRFGMQMLRPLAFHQVVIRIPDDRFIDISFGTSDPIALCMFLEDALNLPKIPRRRIARIPTTDNLQDIQILGDPRADLEMTILEFSRGLATWLKRNHPAVLERLQAA
ncbi:MAG: hypothetical protein ACOYUK_04115 [Patescibacteria group bacterium]